MSQQQKQYLLFISKNCQHSTRLMMQLQKSTLINLFQIINIDDARINLPQFVQCVPTLYIPSKKHVITDTDLFKWFQNEFQNVIQNEKKNTEKQNIEKITGDPSILPFQISEMGSGLSGSIYSFIDTDKNDLVNQNFSFIQDRDINNIPDFTQHNANDNNNGNSNGGSGNKGSGQHQTKTGGSTDSAYDTLMKARSFDMQQRQPPQTPNFSSPM